MKLYQATYEIQNPPNLQTCLTNELGEPKKTGHTLIYENKIGGNLYKRYIYETDGKRIIEECTVSNLYLILTAGLFFGAVALIPDIGIHGTVDSLLISIPMSIGGFGLLIYSLLSLSIQPNVFSTNKSVHSLFETEFTLPVIFRDSLQFSKVVYLNGFLTLIVASPLIMTDYTITIVAPFVTLLSLLMLTKSQFNPSTNQVLILAALSIWPFGTVTAGLNYYSDHQVVVSQEKALLGRIQDILFSSNQADIPQELFIQSRALRITLLYAIAVLSIWFFGSKLLESADTETVYQTSPLITNQTFLRLGMVLFLMTYLVIPFIILLSPVAETTIIDIESTIDFIVLYWPILVIVPGSVVIWAYDHHQRKRDQAALIQSNMQRLFEINETPVLTGDIGHSSAFATKVNNKPYIIINEKLKKELNQDELTAISYHELYHLKNEIHRLQRMSDIPILRYVLFFAFANPVSINKEEFRADEFAAETVSKEAVISALKKTASMNLGPSESPLGQLLKQDGWRAGITIFWKVPLLQLYRPDRVVRICRLQEFDE